jgi:hypothetical protein
MTRRRFALALALGLAACGLKTPPVAPELVEPLPATNLRAYPAPSGVRLVWRRPTRYSGGGRMRDVERFDVERVVAESDAWTVVGRLVMEDRYRLRQPRQIEWIDETAVPGTHYRYRVVTVTRDGYESLPSDPTSVHHRIVDPEPDTARDRS